MKVIMVFLIITLTYSNFILVGDYMVQGLLSYAVEENLESQIVSEARLLVNKVYNIEKKKKRVIQIALATGLNTEKQLTNQHHS